MRNGFAFEVVSSAGAARRGRLTTPHGVIETPAFMAVATYGAVRGVGPEELASLGSQILLANTFHLHERPGESLIADLGGLHGFTGWQGPWLTDSGGFQALSLGTGVELDEEGVAFASPVDGRRRLLTPERAIEIQEALGPDIALVLDQLVPADAAGEAAWGDAMERTLRWAERSVRHHGRPDQALFGIVQGGASPALRRASATGTADLGFDGYAHGGLGLGEDPARRVELVAESQTFLPPEAPRYLMGLGRPCDLLEAIAAGVDLFDCVVPTRHARHGVVYTSLGRRTLRNARYRDDDAPLDPDCDCPACAVHSRAYLRHLFAAGEMLGPRLASLPNLRFYFRLLREVRAAIDRETGAAEALTELRERAQRASQPVE
ncbi:MAG: tRNA guanosine(34) transglycosylase Tgt [Myxococcota bacterium]